MIRSTAAPRLWRFRPSLLTIALVVFSPLAQVDAATLPDIPRGVAVLNTVGDKALRDGILDNSNVVMISIDDSWVHIQPDEATFDWTSYLDKTIEAINSYPDKSILLRIKTMNGSATHGGDTPDWVFTDMGVDPGSTDATAGTTYSFQDGDVTRCIPVFWNPVYLAKKKVLIAMAGAHLAGTSAIKIVSVAYANAETDDWNIPHDPDGDPSEVELWLNDPGDPDTPGAGYHTQEMIDAAIHQGDASLSDGVIQENGTTLISASAVFTQADVTRQVTGKGFRRNTVIKAWISPTQVSLSQRASRHARAFTIVGRCDGLIDVAMAAFPNQYITTAVNGNGPDLDDGYCMDKDPGICLAESVNEKAQAKYPGRYIVQRNNVSAIIPTADVATDAWRVLVDAAADGMPVAAQALGVCWSNQISSYRMNGGTNCDQDNPDCDGGGLCTGDCALSFGEILLRSAGRIETYCPKYYEIYPPDASHLKDEVRTIDNDLLSESCDSIDNPPARPEAERRISPVRAPIRSHRREEKQSRGAVHETS